MEQEAHDQEAKATTAAYVRVLSVSIGLVLGVGIGAAIGSIGADAGMGVGLGVAVGLALVRQYTSNSSGN